VARPHGSRETIVKKLRMFAVVVVVCLLASAALADITWPVIPARPKGSLFTATSKGGPWNTGSTWKGGFVPKTNAVVVIPRGSTVTLSGSTNSLRWVEVYGTLALSSTVSSTLSVDTLLIGISYTKSGVLVPGMFTLDSLPQNLTAQVIFTNNNSPLPSSDTQQVTRGLIGEGIVHVVGLPKANMIALNADLPMGTSSITLNAIPMNWQQSDYIVIAGTHFRRQEKMEDERVRITNIDSTRNVITFSPLQYDHLRVSTTDAQGHTIMPPLHIANLTRNVVFSSAAPYPASYRGHVLIGHQNSDIENVAFVDLGRTDKSRPLDDYVVNPTSLTAQTASKITNIRGRYPLYVFNTVGNPPNNTTNDKFPVATLIQGCVVEGSIGWGFVNRRSNVNFIDNVAYNFIGAGFVAEGGDELGSFQDNIAIHGSGQIVIDQPAHYQTSLVTDGADVNHYRKQRMNFRNPTRPQPIEDIAFNGEGFWFSGPALTVTGNVANSCHGTGMFWHTTGVVEVSSVTDPQHPAFGSYTYFPQTWIDQAYGAGFQSQLGYTPRHWSSGSGDFLAGDLPILKCDTFTGYANFVGFRLRFSNQDNIAWYQDDGPASNPTAFYSPSYQSLVQGTVPTNRRYQAMNNLTLWNNEAAITLTYDAFTTWTNVTGISRLDYDENKNAQNTYPDPGISPNYGVEANFILDDMSWTNLILDGYELATFQWDGTNTDQPPTNVSFNDNPHNYFHYVQDGTFIKGLCSAPGIPTGSADASGNGTITWAAAPDSPTMYLARYRASGDQKWSFASVAGGAANPSVQVSGLIPGKTYQIQVDAGCNKGTDPTTHLPLTGVSNWVTGAAFNAPCAPAAIATQPADAMSVPSGQMATFAVVASGDGPFSYQWYEGASGATDNPVGGDSNTLSIMPESATGYWVSVANACGASASRAAMVTICDPPAIAVSPQSQTITAGSSAVLSVTPAGSGPFTYQWYLGDANSNPAPLGTNSTLMVAPLEMTSFWVVVTNSCGNTLSDTAIVSVCNPPTIAVQPVSQTVASGTAVTLDVGVNGYGPFIYQWYLGTAPDTSNPIPTDDSPLTVAPASTTSYWVSITNDCGTAQSNTVTVTVCNPPAITLQPQSQTITAGSSVTLSVTATGDGPLNYSWFSGVSPAGNGRTLTVTPTSTTSYWVDVSNSCGDVASSIATVTVCNPPTIVQQPQSQTVPAGSAVTLSVTASGSGPFSYQWYQNGTPVGANSSTLAVTPSATTSYWVNVSNSCGSATSNTATVTVCNAPTIVQQPVSQTINAGTAVTLSVTAGGNGPFSYQWYQDGTPVGTNSSTLTVTPSATASYWVSVSNSCAAVISSTATVTVCGPPAITTQPASQTVASGSSATLTVTASGGGTFSYQWYEGASGTTTTAVGTNSSTFTTPPLMAAKSYWVRVTNVCNGTATVDSATATISVQIQILRRQIAGSNANSMPSLTTNWSQPTQAGSLLVAVISASDVAPIGAFTPPVGWQLANTNSYSNIKTSIYYYPNNPGGRTAETFYLTNYPDSTLDLIEYTGVMATSPLDKTAIDEGSAPIGMVVVDTGTTQPTAKPREVVVTALTTYAQTSFTTPTNSFVKIDEQSVLYHLTTAVHESLVTSTGSYGHSANVGGNAQWVGLAVTFMAIDCSGPPTISTQPASATNTAGQPVTLSVTAAGSGFTYQWYQGVAPSTTTPVGTNSSTLTVAPVTTTSYWVNVSSACGSTASNTATVSVCTPPSITAQPQSQTVTAGSSATLSVTVSGNGPFSYQWYQGTSGTTTTPIGTNSGTLTVSPAGPTSYWVNVTNSCGSTASNTATVSICSPAAIVTQPLSQTVPAGSSATLSVTAGGSSPFTYQWYQGSTGTITTPIGTNSSTLTVTPAVTTSYWVRVTNGCGAASSNTATITICSLPGITAQPLSQTVTLGSSATLTVTAGGNGPFTYQWYQGTSGTTTTPVGANSSSLTVTPAATTSYWVRVSNACGPVSSNTATVTVCAPPGIATQPASQSVSSGSSATLNVSASGSGPFNYQWYQGTSGTTTTPVGANSSSFTTPALAATTSYWVRVTSACNSGTANSATATITILTHITRRQLAGNTANSMSSLTANWTQATQAGSLLVAILSASDSNAIGAFTPPAGWQLANTYSFNNVKTSIYYYPNNPGGRTAETFNLTNFPDSTLDLIEYTGVIASSPLDKTGFDGGWNPVNGIVTSGTTASTAQSKEVVITALTTYAQTSFTNATNSFTKIDERAVLYHLTTAVHENIVTTAGSWGHSANAGGAAPWVGLVVTFKSADTTP
jgi:hypothetical protein